MYIFIEIHVQFYGVAKGGYVHGRTTNKNDFTMHRK